MAATQAGPGRTKKLQSLGLFLGESVALAVYFEFYM